MARNNHLNNLVIFQSGNFEINNFTEKEKY